MTITNALQNASTFSELNALFEFPVKVSLYWTADAVAVEGYTGSISTDEIASKVSLLATPLRPPTAESKQLADTLAQKVFIPLKNLIEDPANAWSPYHFFSLKRIGCTPPPEPEIFGSSIALKHAMVLAYLSEKYDCGCVTARKGETLLVTQKLT